MHLTLESLHNAKNTCSEIKGLESLMNAEEKLNMIDQLSHLSDAIDTSIQTINTLSQMRDSLSKCGYSEDWFDNVNQMGFKDLVQIDMPKFFDNKINRQEVCMEGFMETIKDWIKKAWEFIKKFIGKLRDFMSWLIKKLNIKVRYNNQILKMANDIVSEQCDEYFKTKHGVDLNNWVELTGLEKHVDNISKIAKIITYSNTLDQLGGELASYANSDRSIIRREFAKEICNQMAQFGIQDCTNPDNGFVVKPDSSFPAIVLFYDVSIPGRTYKKEKFQLRSANEVRDLVAQTQKFNDKKNSLNNDIALIDGQVKGHAVMLQGEINRETASLLPDNDKLILLKHQLDITSISINTVASILTYAAKVGEYVDNDIALIGAMAKTMNVNTNP